MPLKCEMCGADLVKPVEATGTLTIPAVFTNEVYVICEDCYVDYQETVVKPNAAEAK